MTLSLSLPLWIGALAFLIGSALDIASSLRLPYPLREGNPIWQTLSQSERRMLKRRDQKRRRAYRQRQRRGRAFAWGFNLTASLIILALCAVALPAAGLPEGGISAGLLIGGLIRALFGTRNVVLRIRVRREDARLREAIRKGTITKPADHFRRGSLSAGAPASSCAPAADAAGPNVTP